MNVRYWLRFALASITAAGAGFAIHVLYGRGPANDYVQEAAKAGRLSGMLQEPLPDWAVAVAATTAILPTIAVVVIYVLLQDRLPGKSRVVKGAWFALLLLATRDAFLRLPIMQTVIGMPLDVTLVQTSEGWLVFPVMGFLVALLAPTRPANDSQPALPADRPRPAGSAGR